MYTRYGEVKRKKKTFYTRDYWTVCSLKREERMVKGWFSLYIVRSILGLYDIGIKGALYMRSAFAKLSMTEFFTWWPKIR